MESSLTRFEAIVRRAYLSTEAPQKVSSAEHPFEERNVHPGLPSSVRMLFDDGHFPQAAFEAFKFIDKEVQRLAASSESGFKLMMQALSEPTPMVSITACSTVSEKDEQKGYQFLFAGSMLAIRNPRGHEYSITDSPDACLDYLALASLLLRRLEQAGHKLKKP